jgi:hypothetical protein
MSRAVRCRVPLDAVCTCGWSRVGGCRVDIVTAWIWLSRVGGCRVRIYVACNWCRVWIIVACIWYRMRMFFLIVFNLYTFSYFIFFLLLCKICIHDNAELIYSLPLDHINIFIVQIFARYLKLWLQLRRKRTPCTLSQCYMFFCMSVGKSYVFRLATASAYARHVREYRVRTSRSFALRVATASAYSYEFWTQRSNADNSNIFANDDDIADTNGISIAACV